MKKFTSENSQTIKKMVSVSFSIDLDESTKVRGSPTNAMDKPSNYIKTESIPVLLEKIKKTAKVNSNGSTGKFTTGNGRMAQKMVQACGAGSKEIRTSVNGSKAKRMVLVFTCGPTGTGMRVNSKSV